jgi:hypothetical protein
MTNELEVIRKKEVAGVQAEIWTEYLLNASLEHYS